MPANRFAVGSRINPVFQTGSEDLLLHPPDRVPMAMNLLGEQHRSLAELLAHR